MKLPCQDTVPYKQRSLEALPKSSSHKPCHFPSCPGSLSLSLSHTHTHIQTHTHTHIQTHTTSRLNYPLPCLFPTQPSPSEKKNRARKSSQGALRSRSNSHPRLIQVRLNLKLQPSKCVFIPNKELIVSHTKKRTGKSLHIPSCLHCVWAIFLSVRLICK